MNHKPLNKKFMKKSFTLPIIAFLLIFTVAGCQDDLIEQETVGEGKATVSATLDFKPMSSALARTRAAGDALKDISSLHVLLYNSEKKLIKKWKIQESEYTLSDEEREDKDAENGHSAEARTKRATFKLPEKIGFGRYYIYAVANIPDLLENYSDDIKTVDGLKGITLTWDSKDMVKNGQMMGFFTKKSAPALSADDELLVVNEKSVKLHAWLRRAASKVTVACDGSALKDGVSIYIRSVTVKDIPKTCKLGEESRAGSKDDLQEGGTIQYVEESTAYDESYPARIDKRNPYFYYVSNKDNGVVPADGYGTDEQKKNCSDKAHSGTAEALYFYENMQGVHPDKLKTQEDKNNDGKPDDQTDKDGVELGTYIEVEAYYRSTNTERPGSGPIKYRFMLGKNITDDYDAERNCHYKLTLKFRNFANDADWHIDYEETRPVFTVNFGTTEFTYLGNEKVDYSVTSYTEVKTGGTTQTDPEAWIADFVEDDGKGGYNVIDRPEWLTGFTVNGEGSADARSYSTKVEPQKGVHYNTQNETLKQAKSINSTSGKTPYNLSNSAGAAEVQNTANCYIINAPGKYSLPLVYGNAIKNGTANASAYTSSASETNMLENFVNHLDVPIDNPRIDNAKDAVLVWQDEDQLVTNVGLSDDQKSLTFDVPEENIKQGNAVVAVRDANEKIMWSWHVWVTEYKLGSDDRTVTNFQDKKYVMMPVNIGWCDVKDIIYATRSVKVRFTQTRTGQQQVVTLTQKEYSGKISGNQPYFQFGRKDPMLACVLRGNSSIQENKTWYSSGYTFETQNQLVTIGASIQNPHKFFCSNENWCSKYYSNLWSANNTETTANDKPVVKTIYDPSPTGYCLPPSNAFTGFTCGGNEVLGKNAFGTKFNSPYTSTDDFTDNFGWKFYCNKMTGERNYDTAGGTIFFPASGNRNYLNGRGNVLGRNGCFWSAVPSSGSNSYNLNLVNMLVNPVDQSYYRSYGFAVRPVKEL